jgi:hypothetical protein
MEKKGRETEINKSILKDQDNDIDAGGVGNDLLSLIALIIAEYILNEDEEH